MPNLAKPFSTTAPLGIANRAAETHLPEKTVWDAVNLDITPDGTFWTRRGYTRVRTGHYHSLFAHPAFPFALAAHDGQLVRIAADLTETSLTAVVGPVSYAALDQTVYWSDGVTTGRVTVTTATALGLPVPALPTLTATAGGGLDAGRYQVALTCRSSAREEGGAGAAEEVDVAAGGGITLAALSETAYPRRVYLSHPNGDRLFFHSEIPASLTTWTIGRTPLGRPLETQFCTPPPPANRLRAFQGRVLLAVGSVLYWTRALYPGLIRPRTQFIQFPEAITDLVPAGAGGVYVGTASEVWFLAGADPSTWTQTRVSASGMVAGTALDLPPGWSVGATTLPMTVASWWGTDGVWRVGAPDGSVTAPLDSRFRANAYTTGHTARVQRDRFPQILSIGLT